MRIRAGCHPGRNKFGHPKHAGRIGLDQILVPEQTGKRRGQGGAGHIVEQEYFLLLQFGMGPLGDFGKQNDGHPAGGRTDTLADHQLQIHRSRHHQKADEDRADDGLPVKSLFKVVGTLSRSRYSFSSLSSYISVLHPIEGKPHEFLFKRQQRILSH